MGRRNQDRKRAAKGVNVLSEYHVRRLHLAYMADIADRKAAMTFYHFPRAHRRWKALATACNAALLEMPRWPLV